jgi:MFS superfamily sulfate permease-like transporter
LRFTKLFKENEMKLGKITRDDWIASLVVFIVAMPLSLGIALASGATPAAGLITAIVGGIVAGLFAGAPLSVTGPAAGMTALVFQLVQKFGMEGLAIITFFAGLIQILFGVARAGKVFTWIPHAVLEGVLSAIGLIIVVGQLHVLAGQPIPSSTVQGMLTLPQSLLQFSPVLLCGILAIGIQLVWNKKMTGLKWIPGALPAVIGVTLISLFWIMPRVELEALLPLAQSSFGRFTSFDWLPQWSIFLAPAFGVALVASAESLLTARAIDTLTEDREGFKPASLNQELTAQGAANLVSATMGGLPMTAVMVRSAANVTSGAKTRWSTVLHGTWIAVFVGLLPELISKVPLTALAAVLILTGYKLLNLGRLSHELKSHPREGMLWIATSVLILATDLLTGLLLSLGLAILVNLKKVTETMKKVRAS